MKILFVVAEMQEAEHLIEHYKMTRSPFISIDLWICEDIMLLITGAGINNVISSLSKVVALNTLNIHTNIINVGYAGAKGLNIGDVVTIKQCHCLEFPTKANTGIENCVKLSSNEGYTCYTSFDFVEAAPFFDEAVFDMELAYIARFIYDKLYSIKIISDSLNYNEFKEFNKEEAWEKAIERIEEIRKGGK